MKDARGRFVRRAEMDEEREEVETATAEPPRRAMMPTARRREYGTAPSDRPNS